MLNEKHIFFLLVFGILIALAGPCSEATQEATTTTPPTISEEAVINVCSDTISTQQETIDELDRTLDKCMRTLDQCMNTL